MAWPFPDSGWWSGQEKENIARIEAEYGFQAAYWSSLIESQAQQNVATIQAAAAVQGYEMSYQEALRYAEAQELTAQMNYLGVTDAADRTALAQEYTALMGYQGAERTALAQEFTALQSAEAQRYTAEQAYAGQERSAEAQEYTANQQRKATETAAKIDMHGTVASSGISASSNLVSSGFGAMNYGQRSFNQWAMSGTNRPTTLAVRVMATSVIFVMSMGVLFIAMDIFGIPILATLSNIVAEAGAKAVAFVEAIRNGTGNAGEIFSDYGAGLSASIGGMLSAFWDKMNEFLDWLIDGITDFTHNLKLG